MSDTGEESATVTEEAEETVSPDQEKQIQRFEGIYRLLDSPEEGEAIQALRMARKMMPKIDLTFGQILDMVNSGGDANSEELQALVEQFKAANEELAAAEKVMLGEHARLNLLLRTFGSVKLTQNATEISNALKNVSALSGQFKAIEKTAADMKLPANAEELEEIYRARVAEALQAKEPDHNLLQRAVMKMFRIESNKGLKQLVREHEATLRDQSRLINGELDFVKKHGQGLGEKLDVLLSGATPQATYAEALEGLRDLQIEQGKWREAVEENEGLKRENEAQQAAMADLERLVEEQRRENLRTVMAYGGGPGNAQAGGQTNDQSNGQSNGQSKQQNSQTPSAMPLNVDIDKIITLEGKYNLLQGEHKNTTDQLSQVRKELIRLQTEAPVDTITPLTDRLADTRSVLQGSLHMLESAAEATAREPVKRGLFARWRRKKAQKKIQERVDQVEQTLQAVRKLIADVDATKSSYDKMFNADVVAGLCEKAREETLAQVAGLEQQNEAKREQFLREQDAIRQKWMEGYDRQKADRARKEEKEREQRAFEEETRRNAVAFPDGSGRYVVGEEVPGQGVFFATCEVPDEQDESITREFNVFAARSDLIYIDGRPTWMSYGDTVKAVSELKDWEGHNGAGYKNEGEFHDALHNQTYKGEWIIPPADLLERLSEEHGKFGLKAAFNNGTGKLPDNTGKVYPHMYWSSSIHDTNGDKYVMSIGVVGNSKSVAMTDKNRLSCRLIRLVPVSSPPT